MLRRAALPQGLLLVLATPASAGANGFNALDSAIRCVRWAGIGAVIGCLGGLVVALVRREEPGGVAFWVGAISLMAGVGTGFAHLMLARYATPPALLVVILLGAVVLGAIAGVGALASCTFARLVRARRASDRGSDAAGGAS